MTLWHDLQTVWMLAASAVVCGFCVRYVRGRRRVKRDWPRARTVS